MPPKKDDKKKPGAAVAEGATQLITADQLESAKELPEIDSFVFTNLFAFKLVRNQKRLLKTIFKQYNYINPEDPNYSEDLAAKYRTIDMNQLLTQAQSRSLLTEAESLEIKTMDPVKRRKILAQATVESVTAFQLQLRQKRKEENDAKQAEAASEAAKGLATPASAQLDSVEGDPLPAPTWKFDQVLFLKDFPKTAEDVQELMDFEFKQLNGVFLIEEQFNREIEDDEDDDTDGQPVTLNEEEFDDIRSTIGTPAEGETPKPEKLKNKMSERIRVIENCVQINRILKKQPVGSAARECIVERVKFVGPNDPMHIPPAPEDGSEPEPIDEELKNREFKYYEVFASVQKAKIEELATHLSEFKSEKDRAQKALKQLWPVPIDPAKEAEKERRELLKSQQEEREKLEAAEKAAAETKGGKKSNLSKNVTTPTAEEEQAPPPETSRSLEDLFKSQDDDPSKSFEFLQFQKIMSEIPSGKTSVGSILGAMVFQISNDNALTKKEAMKDEHYVKNKPTNKRMSTRMIKLASSQKMMEMQEIDNEIGDLFNKAMGSLMVEQGIIETDYKHEFNDDIYDSLNSPYMIVKSENDQMLLGQDGYSYQDGKSQDHLQKQILECSLLPGVNKRLDMPEKATQKQSLRESDCDKIVTLCDLPAEQTKRSLILKAFENMMKKALKERTFSFLDRNYIEEYKDAHTVRQIISGAMNSLRPEIVTDYYEMDDGLLVALFFKNPPGRLLRRQWTNPVRVFPDFAEWQKVIKQDGVPVLHENMLDIHNDKVGVMRSNTKFSFPSDNSMIRVDKYNVGQRRFGETQIIKDNYIFGITEKKEFFNQKVEGEDFLRNRDAKQVQDKRCDFWLMFENGVRLNIEMQDHKEADMKQLPRCQLPQWLKDKIAHEKKMHQQALEDAQSDGPASVRGGADQQVNQDEGMDMDMESVAHQSILKSVNSKDLDVMSAGKESIIKSKQDQDETQQQDKDETEPPAEVRFEQEEDPELLDSNLFVDGIDMTKGSQLTFTFQEGLIVQLQPNGDCMQKTLKPKQMPKSQTKGNNLIEDQPNEATVEVQRVITTNGEIIKQMGDGNFIIYFSDGSITHSNNRRGEWQTINPIGVKRVRRIKDGVISDEMNKLNIQTKIDPETNATLKIREDGVLNIEYIDQSHLIIMPDGTNILKKKRPNDEAGSITFITKEGFVPIRQIYDPVKARAKTIIGLGGTDALMGKDNIMERTNTGKISEVLLPDGTCVQSYLEKQELEGYNRFSASMIHLIKRSDFSVVKVRQDGEVVVITANERAYLNEIGKQIPEFGTKDYDYFFELFGVPNERRSGLYTANLDKGRIWTEDEEGNYFIAYANGDTVEKMSVSFNLDQMVEGIENKEPTSPRIKDGEYIEDECKFLPPPKSMAHPRLLYIKNDGSGIEYFNEEQLTHMFRTYHKTENKNLIQTANKVKFKNEDCISHVFLQKKSKNFDAQAFDVSSEFPKLPQNLELVNQTVSIPTEPVVEKFTFKNVIEFKGMDQDMMENFHNALDQYESFRAKQAQTEKNLAVVEPKIITTAPPPMEKTMRSSGGLGSTMMSGGQSDNSNSPRDRKSPRLNRSMTRALADDLKKKTEQAIRDAEEAQKLLEDDTELEFENGLQIYKNELESKLTFMQKLQLRIASERKIPINKLKGDEFQILKDYKKLEERKELMNTMDDYFDPKYDYVSYNSQRSNPKIQVDNESAQQIMSDQGEHVLYSNDSQGQNSQMNVNR